MKKKTSKIISLILAVALAFSSVTFVSYADEADTDPEAVLDEAVSDSALEIEGAEEEIAIVSAGETDEIIEADLEDSSETTIEESGETEESEEGVRADSYTWQLGTANGCETVSSLQGSSTTIYSDLGTYGTLIIDATSGKFDNDRGDQWAQVNDGTVIYVPAAVGSVITFTSYNAGTAVTSAGNTITGAAQSSSEEYTVISSDLTEVDGVNYVALTFSGVSYLSVITENNTGIVEDAEPIGEAENFEFWFDDYAAELGVTAIEQQSLSFKDSTLVLQGNTSTEYSDGLDRFVVKWSDLERAGRTGVSAWKAGNRNANANDITEIPTFGDGTAIVFTPAATGTFNTYLYTTSFLRVWDFNTDDGSRNGYVDSDTTAENFAFTAVAGHTYVLSTTGKTNNCGFCGFEYIIDEDVTVPLTWTEETAGAYDNVNVTFTDAALGTTTATVAFGASSVKLLNGHTYVLSTDDGGAAALVGGEESFTTDGTTVQIDMTDVPDVDLSGSFLYPDGSVVSDASFVESITFINMNNGTEYEGTVNADGTYSCTLKPGNYNTVVSAGSYVTYDRAEVIAGQDNTDDVYLELLGDNTYALDEEIESATTFLTFDSFKYHSTQYGVAGGVGATVVVPVSANQTVTASGSYDGEFTIVGDGAGSTAVTSSGDSSAFSAVYTTADDDTSVTITVTATGNYASGSGSCYIKSVAVETIPDPVAFTSEITVGEGGDYASLTEAVAAVNAMSDRPDGEDGRVYITLTSDLQEQVVIDADYITLLGDGHEINWYYGQTCSYYSVDSNGYYSDRLFYDKYEKTEASGNLWGGVVIIMADMFRAEDTTFRNTFNYYVTEKEVEDGAYQTQGSLGLRQLDSAVSNYAYKERSNAFYLGDPNNSVKDIYVELYNCQVLSSQDTFGRNGSTDNNIKFYAKDCVIGGNVDYICGEFTAVFDNCELQWKTYESGSTSNAAIGYIVAPKTNPYIFRNCEVTVDNEEISGAMGGYGRTWGSNSTAYFVNTETNGYINQTTGWGEMSSGDGDTAAFYEYNNTSSGVVFYSGTSFNSSYVTEISDETVISNLTTDDIITAYLSSWEPYYYDMSAEEDDDEGNGIRGDVDQNGILTANDAASLLVYVLNNEDVNANWNVSAAIADVIGELDGEINAYDVAAIMSKVLNSTYEFKELSGGSSGGGSSSEETTYEETTYEETTEAVTEETTEAESEETTEGSDNPYSFVADRDASSSGYAAGDTVYSDDYITVAALQALTIEESEFTIGDYTYSTSVKSSGVNTSVSVNGASASNWRIHSSITASQDCTVTIATKNPGGKIYAFATLNEDGSYTSVAYYDASNTETEGIEVVLNLTAGDVIYVLGSSTNPEIYAINVEEAEEAGNPYPFVADRDASSDGYAAGDTIYSDDYIIVAALQALTIEESEFTIGNYTYSTSVKSSGVNSSVSVDGASASNWRIHSSITALQDCTVTVVTKNPGGKAYSFATLNEDGTYTSVLSYDTSNTETEGVEAVINLTAGDVVYILGNATNPEIYAINVDDGSGSSSSGSDEEEVDVTDDYIVTLADDGLSFSYSYEDSTTTVEIDESNIYVDGRLTDEEAAQYSNVYNSFTTAMENIKDGTEDSPMNVYIAPYVYWLNDPDSESTEDAYGLILSCANLHLIGLAKHAQNVVIAGNYGHDEGYYNGNWTMFYISGDGLTISDLTIGNYCNVDLVYPLDTSLNVSKRSSSITQAQIGSYDGDKLYCNNVRFISRLNMMPFVSSQRALYVDCHMESTDDSLNGSYQAVYIGCDFEFHSSKPWYSSGGVTLLDCTMKIVPTNVGTYLKQYLAKDVTSGGRFNTIDCAFTSDYPSVPARIGYSEVLSDSYRSYYSNVDYYGTPVTFDYDGEYPDAGVDITGTDFLKAYKVTDESGNVYYNAYNLLRGTDDWDPLGQKDIITSLGCEDIATTLSAWATADTIESGNSDATISWSISGPQTSTDYSTGYSVTYTVDEEDADYVTLTPSEDGSTCLVEGTNLDEESRTVVVEVNGSDGNVAAVAFTVTPLILEAPAVITAPTVAQNSDGTATLSYELDLGDREDESRVIWYVSPTGTLDDAVQVAYGRDEEPLTSIDLNQGYIGSYLVVTLEPKNIRSDYGEAVTAVSDVITADGIEAMTEYDVDITNFSTARKNDVANGFWTIDGYKPSDVDDPDSQFYASWTARTEEEVYDYGVGTSSGFKGYAGLYQLQRGTRLMYTPEGSSYGDMDTTLLLVPGKTASQGFGSSNQYIDILVKLDTTNMTGYGLRVYRKSGSSCAFYLVSYDNGEITALTDEIEALCYAYEVTVHVWTENGVLYATCDSDHDFSTSESGLATSVSLSAEVADNSYGGTAIIHTGTTGTAYANTTYIVADTIKWETK